MQKAESANVATGMAVENMSAPIAMRPYLPGPES